MNSNHIQFTVKQFHLKGTQGEPKSTVYAQVEAAFTKQLYESLAREDHREEKR